MSQTKQEDFDYYLHLGEDFFYMDEAIKDAFIRSIGELYPDFVKHYDTSMYSVFSIMEACYYGGFCSEPKEKLYKADLFNIAFVADNIYGINTEGTSPENILNMPIRLARILDDKAFRFLLEDPKFIENSQKAYKRYSGYFNILPNPSQWLYLEDITENDEISIFGRRFNKRIFNLNYS